MLTDRKNLVSSPPDETAAPPAAELAGRGEVRALLHGDLRLLKPLLRKGIGVALARVYLRRCTRVGHYVRVIGRPFVGNDGVIEIGDRTIIQSTTVRCELVATNGGHLKIGARTWIGYGCSLAAQRSIEIGDDCHLGPYTNILDNAYHDVYDHHARPISRPVTIGNSVWIGTRVIILPGVSIGDGAVVGAGAVVTRDVPARSVVAGNPARVLRML